MKKGSTGKEGSKQVERRPPSSKSGSDHAYLGPGFGLWLRKLSGSFPFHLTLSTFISFLTLLSFLFTLSFSISLSLITFGLLLMTAVAFVTIGTVGGQMTSFTTMKTASGF